VLTIDAFVKSPNSFNFCHSRAGGNIEIIVITLRYTRDPRLRGDDKRLKRTFYDSINFENLKRSAYVFES
jgi:hypothetical protein